MTQKEIFFGIIIGLVIVMFIATITYLLFSPLVEAPLESIPAPVPTTELTPIPIPTPTLTDTELVKAVIAGYFMPTECYYGLCWGGIEPENVTLTNLAMENAKKGTHCLKIIGDTPEQAIEVFGLYELEHLGDEEAFTMYRGYSYDTSYGMAVHNAGNQYNICIVFNVRQSPTVNTTSGGTYIKHPDKIEYLW